MNSNTFYEEHLRFMQSVIAVDDINENDLIRQFNLLLSCLPNGGKLYKYRSLCGKAFKYAYDGLINGYMWVAPANTLNDDFDSIIIADAKSEGKQFIDYIMQDHARTLYSLVKQRGRQYWNEDDVFKDIAFESFLEVFDSASGEMDTDKLIRLLRLSEDTEFKSDRLRNLFVRLTEDLRLFIDRHISALFHANEVTRAHYFVFSLSDLHYGMIATGNH